MSWDFQDECATSGELRGLWTWLREGNGTLEFIEPCLSFRRENGLFVGFDGEAHPQRVFERPLWIELFDEPSQFSTFVSRSEAQLRQWGW